MEIGKQKAIKNPNSKQFSKIRFYRDGAFDWEYSPKPYKVGLVFGAFSPVHYGHIRLFKRAKKYCEKLYACTESNEIIKQEKKIKPFTSEKERIADLYGIKYLDGVYCRTKKENRKEIVELVKPDVLFLGSDWKKKSWEGKHFGIKIIYLPRTREISSTLIRKTF